MENLNQITDESLIQISHAVDDFLMNIVMENGASPSQVTGIMMARLLRMHEMIGNTDNFYRLVETIATRQHEIEDRILQ